MKFSQRLLSVWRRPWRRPWVVRMRPVRLPRSARPAHAPPEAEDHGFAPTQPAVLRSEAAQLPVAQR
jgi:hypothetical protein